MLVVFPKGRPRRKEVCSALREMECQPVPLLLLHGQGQGREWVCFPPSAGTTGATTGAPQGHTHQATGHNKGHRLGGQPLAARVSCQVPRAPPLWTRRKSGICRWGAHQARLTPAPDMHLRLAPPSLCMCRPSGSWNQDEASRWPAPCILPNPDLTGRCGQIPRWQSTTLSTGRRPKR